jgi:hypothetical protein
VSDQGVGNCGFIDPLMGIYEDDVANAPPWWVPLAPAGPITECQAWAAFLCWWCQPKRIWRWEGGKSHYTPKGERFWSSAYDVRVEFAGADAP